MPKVSQKDILRINLKHYRDFAPAFKRVFMLELKPYWDCWTRLDRVKLEQKLKIPVTRKEQFIKLKYGQDGLDLIERLT